MMLWGEDFHPRVRRIKAAANFAELDVEITEYNLLEATELQEQNYLKSNPTGSVPTLQTPDGPIYETNAILRYISRRSKDGWLYGDSLFSKALVDQWLDWGLTELEPPCVVLSLFYQGLLPFDQEIYKKCLEDLENALKILEKHTQDRDYLVGGRITAADILLASLLNFGFQWLFDDEYRRKIPNTSKWYIRVANQDAWQKEYGRPILCKTALSMYK